MPRRPSGSLADVPYHELALALRTQSLTSIAKHYGVHRNTVRYWSARLGMRGRITLPGLVPLEPARVLAALAAQREGLTTTELAQACGVSYQRAYRALRRLAALGQVRRTLETIPGRWSARSRWQAHRA